MPTTWSLNGRTYNLADLDVNEQSYFDSAFNFILGTSDSVERALLLSRRDVVLAAVRAVKAAVSPANPAFRGLTPGDTELGMSPIRPVHTRFASLGHPDKWDFSINAETWTDWLVDNVAATGYTLDKRMGQVILYMKSYDVSPLGSEVKFKIGTTEFMPVDVRNIQLGDNINNVPFYPLPSMLVLPSVDSLYAQLFSDYGGSTKTAIGGLTIGLGAFLKNATSVTWQT